MEKKIYSFPPIIDTSSSTLILGSMPGKTSLQMGQYYAHPRNLFWRLMAAILDIDASAPYEERVNQLRTRGVALWDVLKSCTRASSLDADIIPSSIVTNEFTSLFDTCPSLQIVCFNGTKAAAAFRKYVLPNLRNTDKITFCHLPSTSPANASISFERKLEAWRVISANTSIQCSDKIIMRGDFSATYQK